MSPTSDVELETTTDNAYEWQQVKTTKRRKIHTRQVEHQNIDTIQHQTIDLTHSHLKNVLARCS
jgi:hypothetical protein